MDISEYLKELEAIVNIDSGSYNLKGCKRMADYFAEKFKTLGFKVEIKEKENKHPYLVCQYLNRKGQDYDFLFIGHLDTVFPDGTAKSRPFKVKDNIAYGPGCSDMKSGDLSIFYILKEIIKEDLPVNICVGLSSDEEIGSADSIGYLRKLASKTKYCFNFEAARPEGQFVKQRKGVCDYKITFTGKSAHAGIEPKKGASAITELGRWLVELPSLWNEESGTTLNPGIINGGTASNVVAEHAEMIIDFRYTVMSERDRIEKKFDYLINNVNTDGVKVNWERVNASQPMSANEKTINLINIIKKTAENMNLNPLDFVTTGGGSDSNNIGDMDIANIDGCGPIGGNAHTENEYMCVESVEKRIELMIEVVKSLSKGL